MRKRPTIRDVAKLAGVSKATAARVFSNNPEIVRDETRKHVIEVAEKLGYVRNAIAGSLRSEQTYMVALCIPDITNPFWPEVARGVQDTIEAEGYAVVTVNSDWEGSREENYLQMVRRNRFDGLIINPANVTDSDLLALDVPVVILGSGDKFPSFDSISSNTEQGVQQALTYLVELGHKRIGLIAGISARGKSGARQQSYITFCATNNIPLDEQLIVECKFSAQAGDDAMQRLLSLYNPPTAVLAANDILALGALKAVHRMNLRVPEDVSIIGMDDIYSASISSPTLTTVAKPKYENGRKAALSLLEHMAGNTLDEPRCIKTDCKLVIRESTGTCGQNK